MPGDQSDKPSGVMRVGVLTVSDGCYNGTREDRSGALIVKWCRDKGHEVIGRTTVPDETAAIVPALLQWCDRDDALVQDELDRLVDMDEVVNEALGRAEEMGIIFLDEIDKVAGERGGAGPDVSREGVQRDLLPIVEGSNVQTKYGLVRTDHILFIAAGAFHVSKPSDLIPELQGRFPIRVELHSLDEADFVRILREPKNALVHQYTALMATEGTELKVRDDGVEEVAKIAAELNRRMENIGARRLQTVMTTLLEDALFELPESGLQNLEVDRAFVRERLDTIVEDEDLRRFIL